MSKGPSSQTRKKRKAANRYNRGMRPDSNWIGSVVYKNLPRAGDKHGFCYICSTTDNPRKAIATTTGKRMVFVCKECGRSMRPLFDKQKINKQ